MAAGEQMLAERLDRRRRHHLVAARRHQQQWLADLRGVAFLRHALHLAQRRVGPGDGRRAETERRLLPPGWRRCAHSAPDRRSARCRGNPRCRSAAACRSAHRPSRARSAASRAAAGAAIRISRRPAAARSSAPTARRARTSARRRGSSGWRRRRPWNGRAQKIGGGQSGSTTSCMMVSRSMAYSAKLRT